MGKSIRNMMLHEHSEIKNMLKNLEEESNSIKDFLVFEKKFEKFKWKLEKHFFVEEKVIFSIYSRENEDDNNDLLNLLKDHKDILWLIKKTEDSFSNKIQPDISVISKALETHANFENEIFYPRLDNELDDEQKDLISQRVNERMSE